MDGDWLIGRVALVEVIALKHARHGVLGSQANEICRPHFVHPGGVERHLGLGWIKDLEYLRLIGLGIIEHLFASQRRARSALAAWISIIPVKSPIRKMT